MHKTTDTAPEIAVIVALLGDCPIGGTVTKKQLSDAIGFDIERARYLVYAALRIINADAGALFGTVRGVGYQRLRTDEIKDVGATARRVIRRKTRLAQKQMTAAAGQSNSVTPDERREIMREISVLGMIEHMSQDKNRDAIMVDGQNPVPYAIASQQMAAFLSKIS